MFHLNLLNQVIVIKKIIKENKIMENNEQLALKILKHDNEERYSSSLSQSGYFKIKKGIHTNIIILPDYANQVVLRYKLKKVLRQLKDYFKNLSASVK